MANRTSTGTRFIHLRRPPVITFHDQQFLPERIDLDEVDRRWSKLCEQNPQYFDGSSCHVLGVHRNGCGGATIHVVESTYRFHAVQNESYDLGVRALGVKGLTIAQNRYLMGLRSNQVAYYPEMWEFAPGGVAEPGRALAEVVISELHEETALTPSGAPIAIALIYDECVRSWEMIFSMNVTDERVECLSGEYSQLKWCERDDLPEELSPIALLMKRLL